MSQAPPSRPMTLTAAHVARTSRPVGEVEEDGWVRLEEAEIAAEVAQVLDSRPPGPLYSFAYGSLLWKPEFTPRRSLPCDAPGWHRAFCIVMNSWRATPEAPGLMMALMPGGHCTGLAQEVPEDQVQAAVTALIRRETPYAQLAAARSWLQIETAEGPLTALAFYAPPPEALRQDGLDLDEIARRIARACGPVGSNAEYLYQTVTALERYGIHDGGLWTLQERVAAEIEALPPAH